MSAAAGVVELRSLVERFIALSRDAMAACEADSEPALAAALDARDLLMPQVELVTRRLSNLRPTIAPASARKHFDGAVAHVLGLAADAVRMNAELEARAAGLRVRLGRQLDRLRHDEGGLSAYAATPAGDSVLDLRR